MSASRLILKQPTGWFAAGREFVQVMALVSDGAFKLYVHLCLTANRHTGQLHATVEELARVLARAPTMVTDHLAELEKHSVCRMVSNCESLLVFEIHDHFWPYQKQRVPGSASEMESQYVAQVRTLFLAPACVESVFTVADEKIAIGLHRRSVSLEQIGRAILLGVARKYVSMLNAGVPTDRSSSARQNTGSRTPIISLQYFTEVIEEVERSEIPESYWEPLRAKVSRMEQQWRQMHTVKP